MSRFLIVLARASVPMLAAGALWAAPPPEPKVEERVHEDDNVRIEELRVRGQTQRIVVRPKGSEMRAYQILPDDPAAQRRPGAGQRVWQILSF